MKKPAKLGIFAIVLCFLMVLPFVSMAASAEGQLQDIYRMTGDYLETLDSPSIGSIGGEWMVIGLLRSDRKVSDSYYDTVVQYVQENIDENQRLHKAKSTDNSRIILALTAMGKDVTDVAGHNLLAGLNDLDFVQKQGINGPVWALIALDSGDYSIPDGNVTREALIQLILDAQTSDGGWTISGDTADGDITGMALTALAPYYTANSQVKEAVNEALLTLSDMQNENGGFGTFAGSSKVATSESTAQVLVALSALGIDANSDSRFIKNGNSVVDALLDYALSDGGFRHMQDGERNGMATEQGYYALTAYIRFLNGETRLYDMTDVDPNTQNGADAPTDLSGDAQATATATAEPSYFPWWILILILIAAVVFFSKKRKKSDNTAS